MKVSREAVLGAKEITGINKKYGSEKLSVIYVVLDDDNVIGFNCENKVWINYSSESYWDLYDSRAMMTVMSLLSGEEALEILDGMNAFS